MPTQNREGRTFRILLPTSPTALLKSITDPLFGSVGDLDFSTPPLCEGCELRMVALVLESDCMLVFKLLLLLVEGFEVFAALGFEVVVS